MPVRFAHARRNAGRPIQGRSPGYILIATLTMVVVMTLLASMIALTAERALQDQRSADENLQATLDAKSTEATVMYLLATQRQTFGGLTVDDQMVMTSDEAQEQKDFTVPISNTPVGNEIRLDGTAYQGIGQIHFSLQDDRGRASINWLSAPALVRLLDSLGVPPEQRAPMLAKLKDYQDPDDLYRLNGAEADDYRKAKMDPPSNRTLVSPLELRRVMGWREALAKYSDTDLLGLISVSRNALININTAGVPVLRMIPFMDEPTARRVMAYREQQPFVSINTFERFTGLPLNDEQELELSMYPGGTGTLSLWSERLGYVRHIKWSLTPIDDGGGPWSTQYAFVLPLTGNLDGVGAEKPRAKVFENALPARK